MKSPTWDDDLQVMLRANFYYKPETGEIGRRFASRRSHSGPFTSRAVSGVLQTNFLFKGKIWNIGGHRLAWFLHTGEQPAEVQFLDYDKSNLKFSNLRAVYSREQMTEKHQPIDYNELSMAPDPTIAPINRPVPTAPVNVPLNVASEVEMLIAIGKMKKTPIGGAWGPEIGEILPMTYTYKDRSPAEQARLRHGWKASIYWTVPVTGFDVPQAELDAQAGKPYLYRKDETISAAADYGALDMLKDDAGAQPPEEPAPPKQSNSWGEL